MAGWRTLKPWSDLCKNIAGRTVCAFGDAEVAPIMSTLKHWRPEYVDLIHEAEAANLIRPEPVGETLRGNLNAVDLVQAEGDPQTSIDVSRSRRMTNHG